MSTQLESSYIKITKGDETVMAIDQRGTQGLKILNAGLTRSWTNRGAYAQSNISSKFEMSFEFADFLTRYERDDIDPNNPDDVRIFKIASRKGCYNPPLFLTGWEIWNADYAEQALVDAKIIIGKVQTHCQEAYGRGIVPIIHEGAFPGIITTKMDE